MFILANFKCFFFRLLDFSSLGIKRKLPTNQSVATVKTNGHIESSKKIVKKQKKEDELAKILEGSIEDDPIESDADDYERSDAEDITEEQYLNEQNEMYKEHLLRDSSSESDIESDIEMDLINDFNGHRNKKLNDSDSNIDEENQYSSDDSFMGEFLKTNKKPLKNGNENEMKEPDEIEGTPKTKEIKLTSEKRRKSAEADSDIESNASTDKVKRTKSSVGQNIYANIEKDFEIITPSDDENEKKTENTASNETKTESVLDTSLFKTYAKDVNSEKLSKRLLSDRTKQIAQQVARNTPDEIVSLSSDDDDSEPQAVEKNDAKDGVDDPEDEKRKKRKLLRDDQLADDTKHAQKEEQDRIRRLESKKQRMSQFMESQRTDSQNSEENDSQIDENEVLLDYDSKRKQKITVHPDIRKHLKEHQVDGVKFMYDCCYGSIDNFDKHPGSGCILAHCMGLGKTLQLISLLNTLIRYPQLKTNKILVICPKSTVMNWKEEIERWMGHIKDSRGLKLFQFPESS